MTVKAQAWVRKEIGRVMIWIIAAGSSWTLMAYNWIINCGADSRTASKITAKSRWVNTSSASPERSQSISSLYYYFLRQKRKASSLAKAEIDCLISHQISWNGVVVCINFSVIHEILKTDKFSDCFSDTTWESQDVHDKIKTFESQKFLITIFREMS